MTGDAVRQRLAEISERAKNTTGRQLFPPRVYCETSYSEAQDALDAEFALRAPSDMLRLVAALTAVLDLGAGLSDEHGIVTTGDIRRAVAAALEEQP